jgi:hypothetical protein
MSGFRPILTCIFAVLTMLATVPAGAQENLDSGKSAAQLFASDCAICHKTPQSLAKSAGAPKVEEFLRQHYAASRESAAAIATYLRSAGKGPAAPGNATKRAAKGDGAKGSEKKPAAGKPSVAKSGDGKSGNAKSSEPKTSEPKISDPKVSEPKVSEPKAGDVKASEPKPADGAKPE